jgi:hypothetical protein
MNKGQGATAIGAILLAGVMFKGTVSTPSPEGSTANAKPSSAQRIEPVSGEGPWLASCKYWSAALPAETESSKDKAPVLDIKLNQTGKTIESRVTASVSSENCSPGTDGWGIPPNISGEHDPEISAIIATVPDPIHSHLSLAFDRAIDSILLAAANNHYLASNYWLPWRTRALALSNAEAASSSSSEELEQEAKRETQPGLIILRYAPDANTWESGTEGVKQRFAASVYHRVVYLFLVAETPALGANGPQLRAAFAHEQRLRKNHAATLSIRPPPSFGDPDPNARRLSIIGPFFSGTAASLHEGIEVARPSLDIDSVSIAGVTGTDVAARELDPDREHAYISFGEYAKFEQDKFEDALRATGYENRRIAILSEGGTVFGAATKCESPSPSLAEAPGTSIDSKRSHAPNPCKTSTGGQYPSKESYTQDEVLHLTFPRELSLLRNVQATTQSGKSSDVGAPPSPYLNLSLKDYNADDTVPSLSGTSPASIESQLMSIARQLQRAHSQFIFISASNILDDIFLAQFLHRACPDARLVLFSGGDLLFERDGENGAYVGSISISPYLLSFLDFTNQAHWIHSDGQSEAIYNAASYIFRDPTSGTNPDFAGYLRYDDDMRIPLWATVIGADGYYPLGILNWCASDSPTILPLIPLKGPSYSPCKEPETKTLEFLNRDSHIAPALPWFILDTLIIGLCLLHIGLLLAAQYWSPFTRDLAIRQNDQPHRRAVHINIGTAVLASMAFVTAYPLLRVGAFYPLTGPCYPMAWLTLLAGAGALFTTLIKTWSYLKHPRAFDYFLFNCLAAFAFLFTVFAWTYLCNNDNPRDTHSYAGLFFSYRCLNPLSGVCPLISVLWLLFGWYLWSIFQTARLRFSAIHRPQLPRWERSDTPRSLASTPYPLYVPDNALDGCSSPIEYCLYDNITCLLITREVLRRFVVTLWPAPPNNDPIAVNKRRTTVLTLILATFYLLLFTICVLSRSFQSLDRFFFEPILQWLGSNRGPTLYELLVTALFFPLLMVAFSGWLRTIMIWGALSRGLLEPLERTPLRFAFTRLKGGSWISMIRQSGLHIRWRDMSRTTESIRQLVHHPELRSKPPDLQIRLAKQYVSINGQVQKLVAHIKNPNSFPKSIQDSISKATAGPLGRWDLPKPPGLIDLCLIYSMEKRYATFCRIVLKDLLVPYWDNKRTGLVEDSNVPLPDAKQTKEDDSDDEPTKDNSAPCDYALIRLAEELIVVRYVALIRAVLVNIRYLMFFVSTAFVVAILAWNSYPFHPHAFIDWCFTLLFLLIGTGFIWVFAQMHRNAILSRLTDTKPNELGWEFYLRIITFGAVPVLTWLAYQFPQIGGSLFKILQPGLQVVK